MFILEGPAYLTVLKGNPYRIAASIYLGPNLWAESVAVDLANNTVFVGTVPFVGESPWIVVVVSESTFAVVAHLPVSVAPMFLAYVPGTGSVYTGGGNQNLTEINGSTYVVSTLGPRGVPCCDDLVDFVYDPVTGDLIMMGYVFQPSEFGWVEAIDPVNGSEVWKEDTGQGGQYSGVAVDGQNGSLFLLNSPVSDSAEVSVLDGKNGTSVGGFWLSGEPGCGTTIQVYPPQDASSITPPTAMAFDPNATDLLVGECGGVVRPVSTLNGTELPALNVSGSPEAIAIDSTTGAPFVFEWNPDSVAILAVNASEVSTILPLGGAPNAVAVDSATETAYVASSGNTSVINVSDHRLVGSIGVGVGWYAGIGTPESILFDPASQEIFVANVDNSTVSVISTKTNDLMTTLKVADAPLALAWNNETNVVYVACMNVPVYGGGSVFNAVLDEIAAVGLGVVAHVSLGAITPTGVAYDASLDEVFVANDALNFTAASAPSLTVVSARTNATVATIPLPVNASTEGEVVFDNVTGDLYVAGAALFYYTNNTDDLVVNPANQSVVGGLLAGTDPSAIIPDPGTTYLFAAAGASDKVSVIDAVTGAMTASGVLLPGAMPEGLAYDTAAGQVLVADWSGDSVSYLIPEEVYPATFSETGLPSGTDWSVTLNGTTNVSATDTVSFVEPNGTYPFEVGEIAGYSTATPAGYITVRGTNVTVAVHFALTTSETFSVDFIETGLPSGRNWSVTLNGVTNSSATSAVGFLEPNGTYPFDISAIAGYATATPTGYVTVNGANVTASVLFTPIPPETYSVDFTESGLSPSTEWAVDFNKVTQEGSGPAIIFAGIPNGTYPFTVVPIRNYNISPVSGSVTVAGSNRAQNVTFKEIHVPLGAMINWTTVSGTGFCGGGPFSATVQFYGNGSGGSPPYSFYWTFGDNVSRSTLQDPRYTYTTGPTTATLSVTDSVGNEANKSVSLVWTSSCPPATGTIGDALPVITIVVSLMIAISVGAFAHRVSRVKPRVK
jgi:YVTN family beta-propeller protein